jgi:serine/threonine protein kinase
LNAEYGQGGQVSTQGDVYSYGVLLLEILTGKRPTDETFQDGLSLHNFVKSAFPDKIGMILDPIIVQEIMAGANQTILAMQSCIIPLIKLGLSCSMESPKDRLPAEHISSEVHAIKIAFSNINGRG